jgi:hypothetical protein
MVVLTAKTASSTFSAASLAWEDPFGQEAAGAAASFASCALASALENIGSNVCSGAVAAGFVKELFLGFVDGDDHLHNPDKTEL